MFKNYLKIARRTLVKNKAYAFINVSGLALSMACGILIFTLVKFNLSFDNFHADSNRIYRFVTEQHSDDISYTPSVPPAFGSTFRKDYTYGEQVARIANFKGDFMAVNTNGQVKNFKEDAGYTFAEPEYFNIFNFPLVEGNQKTALSSPNTVVITERVAQKYFGSTDPIDKVISLNNQLPVKVTGVLKNLPANTDQKAEVFISYTTLKNYNPFFMADDAWGGISSALQCFVKLRPGVTSAQVEALLPAYVKKYRAGRHNVHHYKLQPLADIHFDARYGGAMEKKNLYILSFIALFVIITACVNFINLATAQALKRSREVGVRKVLGGMRTQLFWQFIAETGLITLLGVVLAVGIAQMLLPYVNTLFKIHMAINVFSDAILLLFILSLAVVVTFFAGSYPGIILSRFKPVAALKGKISGKNIGGFNIRRALIITQFAISQVLIVGMIVIAVQMHYAKGEGLGFDKNAIVMVPIGNDSVGTALNAFKNQAAKIPGVEKMTVCYTAPSSRTDWSTSVKYDNHTDDENFLISVKAGDDQFIRTFGIELAAGRNIYPSDTVREFLVNETFVRKLNLTSPQQVIGKMITINGGQQKAPIVGVVRDFHIGSFHADLSPVCITTMGNQYRNFAIKINMGNAKNTLAAIEKAWSAIYVGQVYDYKFLDDQIADFYQTEQTMLTLVQAFAFIAIFIGCLGLYGLVMFMASQKTKEIGIRKVLGSTVSQILWIFGKEFAVLIIIAFVIATPVAAWLMNTWLQDFKFHVNLSPLFFVSTILLMFIIASITVGYQATRAALMNPVKSLKTE